MKRSILELYDTLSGDRRELLRSARDINAPFFRTDNELFFNSEWLIYRLRLDTGAVDLIPTEPCDRCNNDHVFSPDGRYLAVSNEVCPPGSQIWIIDMDGKENSRLVTDIAPSYLHGYSPDGKTLLYTGKRDGKVDIFKISADGGEETPLTDSIGHNDGAEYSPDGRYIYFNSTRGGLMDCYRMAADGKNRIRLTDNGRNNWLPHISPDGKEIVYLSYGTDVPSDKHPPDKKVELRIMNSDGTDDRCLVELFGGQGTINVNSWMPGGRWFAFVRYEVAGASL